jgi:hypothetical protein
MKNCQYYVILLLISINLLSGCEKDVDFKGKKIASRIVINSIIHAKSDTNTIKISESVFDYAGQQPDIVENPEIHLIINDKECNQIWMDTIVDIHTYYKFVSKLDVDDKIDLSVHTKKHGTVKGYDNVPNTTEIRNIKTSWFRENDRTYLRLFVTLKDSSQEQNFYRIIVKTKTDLIHPSVQAPIVYWDLHEVFTDDEMLFNNLTATDEDGKSLNFFRIFSDELFQGQEYTLNVFILHDNYAENIDNDYVRQSVKVEIQTLSEKLYQNFHSQELASGIIGDVFSEPVKIYTNIQGGYGILGIYNTTEKETIVAEKGE